MTRKHTYARTAKLADALSGTPVAYIHVKGKTTTHLTREDTRMADDLGTDGLENQVKGAAKEVAGKIRKNVGDLTDNHSEEMKGKAKELEGKAQRKVGEAESKIDRNI